MKTFFVRAFLSCLVAAAPASAFASASTVSDALGVTGNRPVTRAEFVKASAIVLGLHVDFSDAPRKYAAYPDDIRPYVRAVDETGAFDALRASADLSSPITRGEALRLVREMRSDWKAAGTVPAFRDAPAGTELGDAVTLAQQLGWASPLRKNLFGVRAPLRGKEAVQLLLRAQGDVGADPATITVTVKKPTVVSFESQKFRDQVASLLRDEYLYAEKLSTASGSTAQKYVASLNDPYTTLFDPTEAKAFHDQLSGTVTGIGVHLGGERLDVVSVVPGSPAEKAGILAGDRIVSINKKTLEGLPFDTAITRIRGKVGSAVTVGVWRDGKEMYFNLVRATIDVPDTKLEYRNGVAILTVSQFGDHLINDSSSVFAGILDQHPTGVVLDLRGNPGGYLQAVPSVLNEFLPKDSVYLYVRGKSFRDEYVTDAAPRLGDVPLVVLVNGGTASSAEIVSGALQDYGRATIVGTLTYGKGTVQTVVPFQNKSNLKFTIAEWLTPEEHPINGVGITPDVVVDQSDAGDPQLDKALELLRSR